MKRRINYRRIYKNHFGEIPKDVEGRSYDIHHKDGDISNNTAENLIAVSLQEHYDIHYSQEDWGACWAIGKRMKIRPETFAEIVSRHQHERLENNTHNFSKVGLVSVKDREGNCLRVPKDDPRYLSGELVGVNKGYVVAKDSNGDIVRVSKNDPKYLSGELVGSNKDSKRPGNGGHGLSKGKRWKQKEKRTNMVTCPHCGKIGDASGMYRWHFDNCKNRS